MNQKKKTAVLLLNLLYTIALLLFFMDWFTAIEIKSQILKSFAYFGLLAGTPILLLLNILVLTKGSKKTIGVIIPLGLILFVIVNNPLTILFHSSAWKTQTIIYKSRTSKNKTIEFQMQDIGARGYAKRTVQVYYIISLFAIVSDPEVNLENNLDWVKVNTDTNELELKY